MLRKIEKSNKNPPSVTSRNISFNKSILIFLFQMILLGVIVYTAKHIFSKAPPEIHCLLVNFQYYAMKVYENFVQMLHYYMEIGSINLHYLYRQKKFLKTCLFSTN